jgi:peptide/nickel transport system substrate-binding protein/glutathione transport system substrate-binding protein
MNEEHGAGGPVIDRRGLLTGAAALGGAALLPSGLRAAEATTPRKGGTLRISMPYNPASVDPMTGRNLPDFNVLYMVFDALIDFEPKTLKLKPGLAKAWTWKDPKTLVLDLVDGVEFHDGTPFNAEAVKFNLDRYKTDKRSNIKADLGSVANVEVTGKSQVTLHLSSANAGLPAVLTNRIGCMVSPASVKKAANGNVDRNPVGTGPFKFVSWEDNAGFTLVKNDKYWKSGLPYVDGIKIHIINELNTCARTVLAHESDIALNMLTQQKQVADRVKGIVTTASPSMIYYGAFLNYGRPPFNDVKVRQALNYAIDRDELNRVLVDGLGEPSSAILPKESWACDPSTANYYKHDPDRAKKLLAEAGHSGGIEIPTWGWPDQSSMQRQELMLSQVAKSGIRLKITPATPGQAMQNFMIEKHGAMLISPTGGYPDPSQQYEVLFAKTALRNAAKIEPPGFRELMDATETAQSEEARKAAFAKLQHYVVVEQAMNLVWYFGPLVNIMSPKVKNFEDGLLGTPKFTDVWLAA